jgi:hypothetical protein
MVMSSAGPGSKNDCAGKDQKQIYPTDQYVRYRTAVCLLKWRVSVVGEFVGAVPNPVFFFYFATKIYFFNFSFIVPLNF